MTSWYVGLIIVLVIVTLTRSSPFELMYNASDYAVGERVGHKKEKDLRVL